MMTALLLLSGTFLIGGILMLVELYRAPEGYQNRGGFYFIWRNHTGAGADVATIGIRSTFFETAAADSPIQEHSSRETTKHRPRKLASAK